MKLAIARSAVRSDVCADAVGKGGAAMGAPAGVVVAGASASEVNGEYVARAPDVIPAGFAATCEQMGWPPAATWRKLSDGMRHWFESSNGSSDAKTHCGNLNGHLPSVVHVG